MKLYQSSTAINYCKLIDEDPYWVLRPITQTKFYSLKTFLDKKRQLIRVKTQIIHA